MRTKTARIKSVMSRNAMDDADKLDRIDEILNEEEEAEDEDEETSAEDEDTEDETTAEEGDEEETEASAEEGDDDEETSAEDEDEEEPSARAAKRKLKAAVAIAKSKEAKANPAFALSAIASGISFKAFKAMAPNAGKSSGFGAKMADQPGARRLGADASRAGANGGKVVKLKPASNYYAMAQGTARKQG